MHWLCDARSAKYYSTTTHGVELSVQRILRVFHQNISNVTETSAWGFLFDTHLSTSHLIEYNSDIAIL